MECKLEGWNNLKLKLPWSVVKNIHTGWNLFWNIIPAPSTPPAFLFPPLSFLCSLPCSPALTPISHEFSISVSDFHNIFHFNTILRLTNRITCFEDVCRQRGAAFREGEALLVNTKKHQVTAGSWGVFSIPWEATDTVYTQGNFHI